MKKFSGLKMRVKKKKVVIWVACLAIVGAIGFAAGIAMVTRQMNNDRQARFEAYGRIWRKPAPAIEAMTLEGRPWRLSDCRGKVILVDFWASWCPGCPAATQALKPLFDEFGSRSDFVMVGVSLDDEANAARRFCSTYDVKWPQLLEPKAGWNSRAAKEYGVTQIPSIRIIDKHGVLRVVDDEGFDLRWVLKELLEDANSTGYSRTKS